MKSIKWLLLVTILVLTLITSGCWANKNTDQNKEEQLEELEEEYDAAEDDYTEEELDSLDYEEDWEENGIETDTTEADL